MSQLPDDTLRKILLQIQQTAVQSQRNLSLTRAQTETKKRERRILQLTIDEVRSMESDVTMYKGVGKMFMAVPRATMEKNLNTEEKSLSDELDGLNKKSKYLEKQLTEAQSQLRDICPNKVTSVTKNQDVYCPCVKELLTADGEYRNASSLYV